MSKSAFIVQPTSLATQLSALTGRAVIGKSIPAMASNGKPIDPAASKRRALLAAVEKFNAPSSR